MDDCSTQNKLIDTMVASHQNVQLLLSTSDEKSAHAESQGRETLHCALKGRPQNTVHILGLYSGALGMLRHPRKKLKADSALLPPTPFRIVVLVCPLVDILDGLEWLAF